MENTRPESMLHTALQERGYHLIASHAGNRGTKVLRWDVYSNEKQRTVLLQVFRDSDGIELFLPATLEGTVAATIAAIPVDNFSCKAQRGEQCSKKEHGIWKA